MHTMTDVEGTLRRLTERDHDAHALHSWRRELLYLNMRADVLLFVVNVLLPIPANINGHLRTVSYH